jgi:hypothetical protein
MIAFFLTMPMRRTMPMRAITVSSVPVIINASSAPAPADGNCRENRDRMDVTLVEHAEHDEHRRQCRRDQDGLAAERFLIGLCRTGKRRVNGAWQSDTRGRGIDRAHGITECHAGRQVE